jgi:hypothetical protein
MSNLFQNEFCIHDIAGHGKSTVEKTHFLLLNGSAFTHFNLPPSTVSRNRDNRCLFSSLIVLLLCVAGRDNNTAPYLCWTPQQAGVLLFGHESLGLKSGKNVGLTKKQNFQY